jgi:hypothetical protein
MARDPGRALIIAGTVVVIVGLVIALMRTFHVPRYWTPVGVGVALIVAGLLWRRR